MITRVSIDNFKSLVNFDLPPRGFCLSGFTCLIGLNGAGKSTVLQALDFIAQVAAGRVEGWLEQREWEAGELVGNKPSQSRSDIIFEVTVRSARDENTIKWKATYSAEKGHCLGENVLINNEDILLSQKVAHLQTQHPDHGLQELFVKRSDGGHNVYDVIPFEFSGSVLSSLKLDGLHPALTELKNEMHSLRSLELLSPQLMKRRARGAEDIGVSGEKLSPFLDQLSAPSKTRLLELLQDFYPQLKNWDVRSYAAGWKILRILEDYPGRDSVEAGHINDGFLRVIAILAQAYTDHQVLLLDEIENGINPAIVERLVDFLVKLGRDEGKQVIVTTHSPLILNYLEDEVARDSVLLLYKTPAGETRSCRYFDQPETKDKLRALGPGEVFVDTDLRKMVERLGATEP